MLTEGEKAEATTVTVRPLPKGRWLVVGRVELHGRSEECYRQPYPSRDVAEKFVGMLVARGFVAPGNISWLTGETGN